MKKPKTAVANFYDEDDHISDNITKKTYEIHAIKQGRFFEQVYVDPTFNPRKNIGESDADQQLLESIKNGAGGDIEPLDLYWNKDKGKYMLVSGHRRYWAFREAIHGGSEIKRIPVNVMKQKPGSVMPYAYLLAHTVSRNLGIPLTSVEMAETVTRLKDFGWNNKQISTKLNIKESKVSALLTLEGGTETLKKAAEDGDGNRTKGIGTTKAVNIAREHPNDPEAQNKAVADEVKKRKNRTPPPPRMMSRKDITETLAVMKAASALTFPESIEVDVLTAVLNNTELPRLGNTCRWVEAVGDFMTDCEHIHVLETGTPEENGMKFCCYCGGILKC